MTTELLDELAEQIVAGVDRQQFKAVQVVFDGIPEMYCEADIASKSCF